MHNQPDKQTNAQIGKEFERRVSNVLRDFGWNVSETPGSNDFGADLIAEAGSVRLAIQCKCYTGFIGRAAIQEVNHGKRHYSANRAIVIFEGSVSNNIRTEGKFHEVEFFNIAELKLGHELDVSLETKRIQAAAAAEEKRRLDAAKAEEQRRRDAVEYEKRRLEAEATEKARMEQRAINERLIYEYENHTKLLWEVAAFNDELKRTRRARVFSRFKDWLQEDLPVFLTVHLISFFVITLVHNFVSEGLEKNSLSKSLSSPLIYWHLIAASLVLASILGIFVVWKSTFRRVFEPDEERPLPVRVPKSHYGTLKNDIYYARGYQWLTPDFKMTLSEEALNESLPWQPKKDESYQLRSKGFQCSNCNSRLTISSRSAKSFRCPKCKSVERIPDGLFNLS
jgi:hypothetical protein